MWRIVLIGYRLIRFSQGLWLVAFFVLKVGFLSLLFAQKLKIIEIIDRLLGDQGLHCRDVMWSPASPITLTLFIDGKEKIGLGETTSATKSILEYTHLIDPLLPSADYQLEVSSPGIDKPLRTSEHFQEAEGGSVFVKVNSKIDGKVVFKGKLVSCNVEFIAVEVREKKHLIPIVNIVQANLIDKTLGQKEDVSHGS